jgi:nitrogen PTS system EIIA component
MGAAPVREWCVYAAGVAAAKKPFGLLALLKQPLEDWANDEQAVDIVFMLLIPAFSRLEQLNALAVVARRLRAHGVLERVRSATKVRALIVSAHTG